MFLLINRLYDEVQLSESCGLFTIYDEAFLWILNQYKTWWSQKVPGKVKAISDYKHYAPLRK